MDRISNLHDSILTRILSLLPTKLAASTCVLSKRWQFVWLMVYNVDLVCHTSNFTPRKADVTLDIFANLVNKLFTMRDKNLYMKTFRLHNLSICNTIDLHIDSWVLAAILSAVEELDIYLGIRKRVKLSYNNFSSKTLVVLKLGGIVIDAPLSSVHFPSLKVLHLYDVAFDGSFENFLSGCPVLETLVLKYVCGSEIYSDYVITSPTMRSLTMGFLYLKPIGRLCLDAPSLEYLNLDLIVVVNRDIYLKNLDNLFQADVNLSVKTFHFYEEARKLQMVKDALKAMYNVHVLKLKQLTVRALHKVSFEDFPEFHNLVQLELDGFCGVQRMLLSLLRKLSYLQHLTVHHNSCKNGHNYDILGSEGWVELDDANCFSHLRTLCFDKEYGNGISCGDLEFVTHVLKNSKSLENMTITCLCGFSSAKKHAFRQKLASLERASKECQLKFDGEVL